jgi:hypothetical protein
VRIGELNSYSRMAAFSVPYRNATNLAADAVNARGGLMGGRPLVSRSKARTVPPITARSRSRMIRVAMRVLGAQSLGAALLPDTHRLAAEAAERKQ